MKKDLSPTDFNLVEKNNYFAMQLFPFASKQNARRLLTQFCRKNPNLICQLRETGWDTKDIFVTRPQIRIILHRFSD